MSTLINGFIAGFVATVVLSALMLLKGMMGVMPELDVISMLSAMMKGPAVMGWIGHFMVGTVVWGGGFALVHGHLPGGGMAVKGIIFGIAAWLLMMIMVMPMAGAGMFGIRLGMMAPVMTLVLHVIFGAVLGVIFEKRNNPITT